MLLIIKCLILFEVIKETTYNNKLYALIIFFRLEKYLY